MGPREGIEIVDAARVDEHTVEVLSNWGSSESEIASARQGGPIV